MEEALNGLTLLGDRAPQKCSIRALSAVLFAWLRRFPLDWQLDRNVLHDELLTRQRRVDHFLGDSTRLWTRTVPRASGLDSELFGNDWNDEFLDKRHPCQRSLGEDDRGTRDRQTTSSKSRARQVTTLPTEYNRTVIFHGAPDNADRSMQQFATARDLLSRATSSARARGKEMRGGGRRGQRRTVSTSTICRRTFTS